MTLNLVRVSKVKEAGLLFEPATFYGWHHKGIHPEIFISLDGALFIDTVKFQELLESRRGSDVGGRKRGRKRKDD